MTEIEFRRKLEAHIEALLHHEGYELISRDVSSPLQTHDNYKPRDAMDHRSTFSTLVLVISSSPLAAIVSITRRPNPDEAEFEPPITVLPLEAQRRITDMIGRALAKAGNVTSLSRLLTATPVLDSVLNLLKPRDLARLIGTSRSLRNLLSSRHIDRSYWKPRFEDEFPNAVVDDAMSDSAFRAEYYRKQNAISYDRHMRVHQHRVRPAPSPDEWLQRPPRPPGPNPLIDPFHPNRPDPDMPIGPFNGPPPGGPPGIRFFDPFDEPGPNLDLQRDRDPFGGQGPLGPLDRPARPSRPFHHWNDRNDFI